MNIEILLISKARKGFTISYLSAATNPICSHYLPNEG